MANKKLKIIGETLARIAAQSIALYDYIINPETNGGKIGLKELKDMSNVIVSNIKYLESLDKGGDA